MKRIALSLLLSLLLPTLSLGHEGHGGGVVEAPHGGIVKEGKNLNLELISQGSEIMLYPLAHDGETLALKDVKVTATMQPPKKPKTPVELKPMKDHFHAKVDAKGSYRYELKVETTVSGEKKDSFTFQVEPQ